MPNGTTKRGWGLFFPEVTNFIKIQHFTQQQSNQRKTRVEIFFCPNSNVLKTNQTPPISSKSDITISRNPQNIKLGLRQICPKVRLFKYPKRNQFYQNPTFILQEQCAKQKTRVGLRNLLAIIRFLKRHQFNKKKTIFHSVTISCSLYSLWRVK